MNVLDASALLAYLFREAGSAVVSGTITDSCMSTVNLSEVIARFVKDGYDTREVFERLSASGIEMVPFRAEDAALAASLIPYTRRYGLSFAERACLALGLSRKARIYTLDRVWQNLDLDVSVQLVR